ncbi:hypothetical protein OVS_03960 [Mycoplasma ovis str. Michigan]|uniref:Uncharacterized protein n=1 Tax=Mycoplasma ovis str. Michigan TaxID=1415773 RepID=A0ABM5P2E5_9MOLU|nr:hypothetical protein [Mycoplasma ovis]AHC40523.1 hypothetical protein OVS_03960 [Mycoplasma ovis str. Michigan]
MASPKVLILGGAGGLLLGGAAVGVGIRQFRGTTVVNAEVTPELQAKYKTQLESKEQRIKQLSDELTTKTESVSSEKAKYEKELAEKEENLQELEKLQKDFDNTTKELTKQLEDKKKETDDTKLSLAKLKKEQTDYSETKKQLETRLK